MIAWTLCLPHDLVFCLTLLPCFRSAVLQSLARVARRSTTSSTAAAATSSSHRAQPAATQFAIPIGGMTKAEPSGSLLPVPVVRASMPGSSGVLVHGPWIDCHVAIACVLPRCMSLMSTLTAFVPLCAQSYDSFDLYELIRATGAAARERTSGFGAGSRV